jgi:hypothetical protein
MIRVTEAGGLGFHLGNWVTYISRAGTMDPAKAVEDLERTAWYLRREIARFTVALPVLDDCKGSFWLFSGDAGGLFR